MNAISQESLEARIARLERSLTRTRWGMLGLLVTVVALALVWYGIGGIVQRQVVAKRIVMVDDAGTMRFRIGEDRKNINRKSRTAGLIVYDSTGTERGGIVTMANGGVAIGLDAPHDVAGNGVSDRLGMMVDGKGHSMFMFEDKIGTPVVMMQSGDKGGTLQVLEATPDQKQLQVRTLGVKGDTQSTMSND